MERQLLNIFLILIVFVGCQQIEILEDIPTKSSTPVLLDNNTSEIIADQNEVSVGITSPIEQQNATYSFLSKEIVNIGIITSILLAGLVVTSLIA